MSDGGAERVTLNLVNNLARRYSYDVELVLARAEGPFLSQVDDNVTVVDFGCSNTRSALFKLTKYIKEKRPIAVVSAMHHANVVALLANKLSWNYSTRVIATLHINLSVSLNNPTNVRGRYILPVVRATYRWAYKIIGVSNGVLDDFTSRVNIDRQKTAVIYNPGITSELKAKAKQSVSHRWFGEDAEPVVLAVGRLSKQKNFGLLIDSFECIKNQTSANLLILGEGDMRNELQDKIDRYNLVSRVELAGFVDNPYAFMAQAKVFVMSSLFEGLPTVLIEALYCGANLVSTDCPSGPYEILQGGKLGALVPMNNKEALGEALIDALRSPVSQSNIDGWRHFQVDAVADKYLQIISN
jgi:glycosyltransferase involved in cell wall biosynthesis